jgi:hypothetical protein
VITMPSEKVRISLGAADVLASALQILLAEASDRVQIVGSVRRRRPVVGDLEFLAVPRPATDLFGKPLDDRTEVDAVLAGLIGQGKLEPGDKAGPKYKRFYVLPAMTPSYASIAEAREIEQAQRIPLDLYLCRPETWGVLLAIRTGPAEFAEAIVTQTTKGGRLRPDLRVKEGRVWRAGMGGLDALPIELPTADLLIDGDRWYQAIATREEREFLELAGGFVEPHERDAVMARKAG